MKRLLISCALLLSAYAIKADEVITIHMNDSASKEIVIANIQKITFDAEGLNIFCYDNNNDSFNYSDISKLTFDEGVGIETITAPNTSIVVAPNPTNSKLAINGADNLYGSVLRIYSISGTLVAEQANWNGEIMDVSRLSSGIYFISIGSTTTKFIKQ